MLHKIVESTDLRIDVIKPRRVRSHESVENTNGEEKENLPEDKSTHDEGEGIEK